MPLTRLTSQVTVDAFSTSPFAGNPAAVIIFPGDSASYPEDEVLQKIAAEFNYAETAYIRKRASGQSDEYDLRWFTPTREVKSEPFSEES